MLSHFNKLENLKIRMHKSVYNFLCKFFKTNNIKGSEKFRWLKSIIIKMKRLKVYENI